MSQPEPAPATRGKEKLRALIVALAHNWVGIARLPNALARHGYDVSVISPAEALITFAQPLIHVIKFQSQVTPQTFWNAVSEEIERFSPHILIPGDDLVVHLLHEVHQNLALAESAGAIAPRDVKTNRLLEASLGNSAMFEAIERKSALVEMAQRSGIPIPSSRVIASEAELNDFAREVGFPVILKVDYSSSGMGVLPCENAQDLKAAYARVVNWKPFRPGAPCAITAQRMIAGTTSTTNFFAQRGKMLAAFSALRRRTYPNRFGIVSISEPIDSPPMIDLARRVIEYFGMSGLGAVQMLHDERTGKPLVMELNARTTPISYIGEIYGIDLIAHMSAAITGQPPPPRTPPRYSRLAIFPNEWLRDPNSAELNDPSVYHDVPWDQPKLLAAIVRAFIAPAAR